MPTVTGSSVACGPAIRAAPWNASRVGLPPAAPGFSAAVNAPPVSRAAPAAAAGSALSSLLEQPVTGATGVWAAAGVGPDDQQRGRDHRHPCARGAEPG
jgi:hypothetical protein